MTSQPPEPPAPGPPSPEKGQGGHGRQPGQPDEWRAFQRRQGDQPANGHRAATAYPRGGGPDYPPDARYEHAPDHPSGAASGHDDYLNYPDYPDYPGYPAVPSYPGPPGYPPDSHVPADYPPTPDYPAMPDYPAASGYPPTPDYPRPRGYRPALGHLAAGDVRDRSTAGYSPAGYPRAGYPPEAYPDGAQPTAIPGAPVTHEGYVHPQGPPHAGPDHLRAADAAPAAGSGGTRWAMLTYLTVPFFGFLVPLAIYLGFLRRSPWVRGHAAQAINVWLTGILYELSAAIIGAILVLDSPRVALTVVLPLAAVLWLVTLAFLVRAAGAAGRGEAYTFPRWLCAPLVR